MSKITLTNDAFAIRDGAEFKIANEGKLKINPDGTLVINFELANPNHDLKVGEGEIEVDNESWGIFQISSSDNFMAGTLNNIILKVTSSASPQVILKSKNLDVDVISNGIKGEHGISFQKANKNKD